MEDDQRIMEDDQRIMEDDQKIIKMEDNQKINKNGRQPKNK